MNPSVVALGVGLLVTLSLGLIFGGILKLRSRETPDQRIDRLTSSLQPLEQAELEQPFLDRAINPWFRRQLQAAGRLAPAQNIEKLQHSLARAGYPRGLTFLDLLGAKLLAGMVGGAGMLYLLSSGSTSFFAALLLSAVTAVIGFLLPDFWLGSRVRQRQKEISRALPDTLDMLTICVDAGAGLDSAMLKISQKWQNAIASEFGKVVAEIGIGLSRREALQNMYARTDVPEVGSFVAVLLQADQFGLSIANVLHNQSEQMRGRRWQRAEEEARKVPIKMLFPLIFLILPALFAVTIGPAIPVLMRTFAELSGQ
jgi:tight adherence protein C